MNRFVESLLLGFPVPGIFLVQQPDKKLLVLDGQQRLKTLQSFFAGNFVLEGVVDAFAGRRYLDLSDEDRRLLDNTFIHATIVKYEPGSAEAIYQLFERLNTGGTNLYPHEIRVALYGGKLVDLVRDLNAHANWRNLYGDPSPRLKDHELILRFIALYYDGGKYERPLKTFLNSFTKDHRNLEGLQKSEIERVFGESCDALWGALGRGAFRLKNAINAALVDAVMIGMARRLAGKEPRPQAARVRDAHSCLLQNQEFLGAIGRATADEERVKQRLQIATDAFSGS